MLKVPEAFRTEFEEELAERTVLGAQIGCLLLIFLFPLFGILDFLMYPETAWSMGILRLLITPMEIGNLLLLRSLVRRGTVRRWIRPLQWLILYPPVFALDLIILKAGGADSPYYAGLGLVLLGMMVCMPWSPLEMATNALFIWLQYAIVMWGLDPGLGDWRLFVSNNYFMLSTVIIGLAWTYTAQDLRVKEFLARKELAQEKERSEQLLLNILPAEVADELMRKGRVEARSCPSATILFTDFAGFTGISNQIPAAKLVESLDRLFSGFDEIITRHGLEKLKTIGDAYMCVGGLPTERPGHMVACVLAALEIIDFLERDEAQQPGAGIRWQARIGIHRGPVIAGVIGNRKFAYDVWGDTVNLASRLEASSEPGRINITTAAFEELKAFFVGADRGYLPVKGKGPVAMTFVKRLRPEFAADELGFYPNARFWQAVRGSALMEGKDAPKVQPGLVSSVQQRRIPMTSEQVPDLWNQLRGLTDSDKRHLQENGESFDFGPGEQLVTQGEHLDALILIVEGHVGVRLEQDDTKIDISIVGSGDIIGDMSFVTGEAASASVVAIEPGRAVRVLKRDIEAVLKEDVSFAGRLYLALANLLALRLRETNSRLPPLSLLVEEVAHTKLHHSMITGRVGSESVPGFLAQAVDDFKDGMRQLDRQLLRAPEVTAAHQARTKELVDGLKAALSAGLAEVAHRGQAFQDGVGSFVFRETFPYFMLSRMIDRSFSKPRGYAGDYYTIELIHLMQPQGDSRLGPLIDREYLMSPPCEAVRNRRSFMADALKQLHRDRRGRDEMFLLTSLASGAARELFDFMATLPEQGSIFASLLDIDIEALTYSSHIAHELGMLESQLLFAKENVLHLALGRGRTRLPPQDVVYSIGLADYLKDDVVVKLLNWIYDTLKPGGTVAIGNFATSNPDRDFMDHILDWRLYHRSHEDMERLFASSRFGAQPVDVRVEPAQVNLIAFCKKSA